MTCFSKTIQAIALMLTNRPNPKDKAQLELWNAASRAHEFTDDHKAGTLIVLPTIAIRQWQMEIARFTRENSLKVKVYHGSNRDTTIKDLQSYDVIITSYAVKPSDPHHTMTLSHIPALTH